MSDYWDDINKHEERTHNRLLEYIDKKHEHKMEELDKEVELYKLKKELEKK